MPVLLGGLTVFFLALGLAAIPMLRDEGPVERLGGRIGGVREPTVRRSVSRGSSRRSPRGSGRGSRRACARRGATALEQRSTTRAARAA